MHLYLRKNYAGVTGICRYGNHAWVGKLFSIEKLDLFPGTSSSGLRWLRNILPGSIDIYATFSARYETGRG